MKQVKAIHGKMPSHMEIERVWSYGCEKGDGMVMAGANQQKG